MVELKRQHVLTPMLLQTSMFYFQEDVRQNDRLGHHSLALHEKKDAIKVNGDSGCQPLTFCQTSNLPLKKISMMMVWNNMRVITY